MAIEQTLLTSGKRFARLLIQNPEQIKLWQLFKALGQLEKTAGDVFVPTHAMLRNNVIVLDPLATGQKGLGFFKRLWATLRLGLSKLWVAMGGPEKEGGLKAFAHTQKVLVPSKTSIIHTLQILEKGLYSLEHVDKTGTKQHELGHAIMGYLGDHRFQEIVLDADIAKELGEKAAAFVRFTVPKIDTRQDLIKRLLVLIGGDASINQPFKKAMNAVKSLDNEAYSKSLVKFFGAAHDFHTIQQLLLKHQSLLTSSEREALEKLNFKALKLDQPLKTLSKEDWIQFYQDCETLLSHPLVNTTRTYAAAILDSIPTEIFNRMTVTMTPIKGNKTIRGFIENALTREKLQQLKSDFIDSLLSEKGSLYEQLSQKSKK